MSFEEANHPPVPKLTLPETFTVKSGEGFYLDALDSTDPNGDTLSFLRFQYPEISSYKKKINMGADNVHIINLTAPEVSKRGTLHFII